MIRLGALANRAMEAANQKSLWRIAFDLPPKAFDWQFEMIIY
jgi:hypothetical protein